MRGMWRERPASFQFGAILVRHFRPLLAWLAAIHHVYGRTNRCTGGGHVLLIIYLFASIGSWRAFDSAVGYLMGYVSTASESTSAETDRGLFIRRLLAWLAAIHHVCGMTNRCAGVVHVLLIIYLFASIV